jgi:hypothetical protein
MRNAMQATLALLMAAAATVASPAPAAIGDTADTCSETSRTL